MKLIPLTFLTLSSLAILTGCSTTTTVEPHHEAPAPSPVIIQSSPMITPIIPVGSVTTHTRTQTTNY